MNAHTEQSIVPPSPMLALRDSLLAQGFREYETMAGWRPLTELDLYGMRPPEGDVPAGVNWRARFSQYAGEALRLEDGRTIIRDVPTTSMGSPFRLGAFPIR